MTTGVNLSAILHHPRLEDVVVLGGEVSQQKVAGCVAARDIAATVTEVAQKVLVVLYSEDRDDWRLDNLLHRAHQHGAVAVLIEGHAPLNPSTTALAELLRTPILGASDPFAAQRGIEGLIHEPRAHTADLVLAVVTAAQQAGPTLEDAVHRIGQAIARPLFLVDTQDVLVRWNEDISTTALHSAVATHASDDRRARWVLHDDGQVFITCPVRSGTISAWLVAVLPERLDAEIEALSAALTTAVAPIGQRLATARLALERDALYRTTLLGEIIEGRISEVTRRRALDLGWRLDGWHTGIYIGLDDELDITASRPHVVSAFDDAGMKATVVERGQGWAVWLTAEHELSAKDVQLQATAIRRAHRALGRAVSVYVGVGRLHFGPEGVGHSLGEAADAASLARQRPASGRFLHVDRLGLAQLLLAWTRTDTFQPAAMSLLEPLTAELIETLTTYLDSESSVNETAAILGVHRNTVASRITRIQRALDVDLSVADDRLALHLACRAISTTPT